MADEAEFNKAKSKVFQLLKIRLRSENEIRLKLKEKKFTHDVINKTARYFNDIGLIDDTQFAKSWIRSRLKKPFGVHRIIRELQLKGIDKEIIKREIEAATIEDDTYQEHETILDLAERRLSKYKGLEPAKQKQRLYGFLSRRGFNLSEIQKVIRKILN